jgi:hypothetical protein
MNDQTQSRTIMPMSGAINKPDTLAAGLQLTITNFLCLTF